MGKLLYLGTDPSELQTEYEVVHYPIIKIVPRSFDAAEVVSAFDEMQDYTHFIVTSKNAASLLFAAMQHLKKNIHPQSQFFAIGSSTASALEHAGIKKIEIAKSATQEGMIDLLKTHDLSNSYLFYPRSSLARENLLHFLISHKIRHRVCDLYDTHPQQPNIPLNFSEIDEIYFTSPSTVAAFFHFFPTIPPKIKLTPIGPITARALADFVVFP